MNFPSPFSRLELVIHENAQDYPKYPDLVLLKQVKGKTSGKNDLQKCTPKDKTEIKVKEALFWYSLTLPPL